MGFFSKKQRTEIVHPDVDRRIFVRCSRGLIESHLPAYDEIMGPRVPSAPIPTATEDDWTVLVMPRRIHPWAFHNLAMWMLDAEQDGAEIALRAENTAEHVGYWLVHDDEVGDWLCGRADSGRPISVQVPDNAWVWDDAVPVEAATFAQVASGLSIPASLLAGTPAASLTARFDDVAHDLNPLLEASYKSRDRMRRASGEGFVL